MTPTERLQSFATNENFLKSKGALNVGLVITRRAINDGLPLNAEAQLSPGGGQVKGLNGAAGDAILQDYKVTRSIGSEVGRTNRNSVGYMRKYVQYLNDHATVADLVELEEFWVNQFVRRFAMAPFKLRRQAGRSTQMVLTDLFGQVQDRQRGSGGAMVLGTVLQHLVGAKLQVALAGKLMIEHHGANVSDAKGRGGDFDIGDTAIHVTSAPGELLLRKCQENVHADIRPIIVTTSDGVAFARNLAAQNGLNDELEIYAVDQFISLNVSELGLFRSDKASLAFKEIVEAYNKIIDEHENDPSLRIRWS